MPLTQLNVKIIELNYSIHKHVNKKQQNKFQEFRSINS